MVSIKTIKRDIPQTHKNGHAESVTQEFIKKDGIIYCLSCGKENSFEDGVCIECGKNIFLSTIISEIVGGYIELVKKGKIKDYYHKKRYSKSIIKMNSKRMIHQLLINKNKINISKEIVNKIYNANIT